MQIRKKRCKIKRAGLFLICAYGCFLYAKEISYFPADVEQAAQTAAQIEVYGKKDGKEVSLGRASGFFIQDSKTFVTNAHVIPFLPMKFDLLEDLNSIRIKKDGRSYRVKSIQNISIFHDLSVLEVENYAGPFLKFGKHNLNEDVYTMGFVPGKFHKLKARLSYYREEYPSYDLFPYFTDYEPLRGMSGSPVVNSKGRLIGVMSQYRSWNISVIKSEFLKNLLNKPLPEDDIYQLINHQWKVMEELANNGDMLAQQKLGELFLHDAEVWTSQIYNLFSQKELQQEQVLKWTKKAALQRHPRASFNLGGLYLNGFYLTGGLDISEESANKEAFHWIRESALMEYPYAEFVLGFLIYKEGIGVAPSKRKTFEWVHKAALSGHPRAGFEVGLMYLDEDYGEPSQRKAMEWIHKAALLGNALAQFTVGLMNYVGAGLEQNFTRAFQYFHSASEVADHNPSQFILGTMYGRGIGVERDSELSHRWLAESMLEGRFGAFADLMGGASKEINLSANDAMDYVFIQLVMDDPLSFEKQNFKLKDIVQMVKFMENTHFSF